MKKIMEFYESYFDEESGNTRQEGLDQVKEYLEEELKTRGNSLKNLQKNINELNKEITSKKEAEELARKELEKASEENKNLLIPMIPINFSFIFRVLLTIFSFSIYFNLFEFTIPDIILPGIIISMVLFLWECYRLYNRVKNIILFVNEYERFVKKSFILSTKKKKNKLFRYKNNLFL
uniref:hypothetical protein n=1 Tax=Periconia digitata TaxID=1303443 RepID=UPI0023AA8C09|nr:hypothetical protein P1Q94_mgp10 [Periconia digitata]WCA44856.1 hypothetical protein [Periconia digitata]